MRKGYAALLLCMVGLAISSFHAEAKKKPSISAESAIVMDVQSGTILYQKNMDKKQYPASRRVLLFYILQGETPGSCVPGLELFGKADDPVCLFKACSQMKAKA